MDNNGGHVAGGGVVKREFEVADKRILAHVRTACVYDSVTQCKNHSIGHCRSH